MHSHKALDFKIPRIFFQNGNKKLETTQILINR